MYGFRTTWHSSSPPKLEEPNSMWSDISHALLLTNVLLVHKIIHHQPASQPVQKSTKNQLAWLFQSCPSLLVHIDHRKLVALSYRVETKFWHLHAVHVHFWMVPLRVWNRPHSCPDLYLLSPVYTVQSNLGFTWYKLTWVWSGLKLTWVSLSCNHL